MNYFEKLEKNPYEDLRWNIPERKQGIVNVIGGNAGRFRDEVKVAEYLGANYPIEVVNLVLPDALREKLPALDNLRFMKSTESGSFADGEELATVFTGAGYNLLLGDLSRNAVTGRAIASAVQNAEKPLLLTRDSVDVVADNMSDMLLMNENLVFFASIAQLAKLFRSVYYPKMLLMSQSLVQIAEALHKFTLSYPIGLVTLHNEQVLVAKDGTIKAVPLEATGYSPIMFWMGELAAKIVAMNLYSPGKFIEATVCGVEHE